ncbi:MAG: hypothetical protein KatS3mg050_4925 [Litorilinea sp.]|nr:MAG: hypothetical protein KatS3mg050_4925 [Litorilinea sp.]
MKTSIIIPVWNGSAHLPACLDSLLKLNMPSTALEIIAVDNASSDGSADLIADRYPQVRLLRNARNEGFAGGCNRGLEVATGEYLILLNQDTAVTPSWLDGLQTALTDPAVGVAGCKILYPDSQTIQHAGGWLEWPLALARHHGHGELDRGQWDVSRDVEFVTGAGLATRRDVLERIGLLDEGFWPGYFEDVDFCLRAREAGYRVRYVAEAVMMHQESTSLTDPAEMAEAYQKGRLRLLLKHTPPDRFLESFIPAEEAYQPDVIASRTHLPLLTAYQAALLTAPAILAERWQANAAQIQAVQAALLILQNRVGSLELEYMDRRLAQLGTEHGKEADAVGLPPFHFSSAVPILGPFIRSFRWLWYNMAARWPVEHLRSRQEQINREQARLNREYAELLRHQAGLIRMIQHQLALLTQQACRQGETAETDVHQAQTQYRQDE